MDGISFTWSGVPTEGLGLVLGSKLYGAKCANRISGAGELQLRLNGHEMNVVRVGLASEAVEVDERV